MIHLIEFETATVRCAKTHMHNLKGGESLTSKFYVCLLNASTPNPSMQVLVSTDNQSPDVIRADVTADLGLKTAIRVCFP